MMSATTTFMLLYGDYPTLHVKTLSRFFANTPRDLDRRFWLNAVCPSTLAWLVNHLTDDTVIYVNDENRPKYPAMRAMFHDPRRIIETPWITWFDDDTLITQPDWFAKTLEFIAAREHADIAFFGQQRRKGHQPGIRKFIRESAWFADRKFQRIKGEAGSPYHGPGIVFVQGSYWWLRTDVMVKLDWPDPRLNHNGGDTLLSEAVWQQRYRQFEYHYGVSPNNEPRRGRTENPAGFRVKMVTQSDNKPASMIGKLDEYKNMLTRLGLGWTEEDAHTIAVKPGAIDTSVHLKAVRAAARRSEGPPTNREILDRRHSRRRK